jgi:hypothetical protein
MEPTTETRISDEDIKTVWPQGGSSATTMARLQDTDGTDTSDSDGTDSGDSSDAVDTGDAGDSTDGTDTGGGDTDTTDAA